MSQPGGDIFDGMTPPKFLDLAALPSYLKERHGITGATGGELTYKTVRGYHQHAEQRRRAGTPRPGDLPEPDERFGRSPVWLPETIDRWASSRPGHGAGGGRPAKREE